MIQWIRRWWRWGGGQPSILVQERPLMLLGPAITREEPLKEDISARAAEGVPAVDVVPSPPLQSVLANEAMFADRGTPSEAPPVVTIEPPATEAVQMPSAKVAEPQPAEQTEVAVATEQMATPAEIDNFAGAEETPQIVSPVEAVVEPVQEQSSPKTDRVTLPEIRRQPIDWRGPGYLRPGGYALRWGLQPVFRPRSLPALPPPSHRGLPSVSRESPPSGESASAATAPDAAPFSFLISGPRSGTCLSAIRIDPATFTEFLLTGEEEASSAASRYWTHSAVQDAAEKLMAKLLADYEDGEPPLPVDALLEKACQIISEKPAALLVCHNVTRAFARGSTGLKWRRFDAARGLYRHGERVYRTSASSQQIFYKLFDRQSLGALDPGDWYWFFGRAAATAFVLTEALEAVIGEGPPGSVVLQVNAIARQLLPDHATDDRRQYALAWVNAMQFWEWGMYSRSADATRRSAKQGLDAFRFGVRAAALDSGGGWRWHVPKPADLRDDETAIDVAKMRLEVQEPAAA